MSQENKKWDCRERQIEVLAPAGSFESFRAAIAAGADAVYAGGSRFGARAFAENFTEQQLLDAIDYAHLHGRRFYLTVNTLLKDDEISDLPGYLEPLYLGGLDAVIVQDMGVLEVVRQHFPKLEIHASTQMTITGVNGAQFLKEMGAVRVVPAREISLEEVRAMKDATGLEIECFVHGALCYCYSGECLLSSFIGGRSGNRGQCAQPCRLPYRVDEKNEYLLSLKDICTLDIIPDLIEARIDSFKIEGRMKRPEYVAGVTAMYRKYVDLYLSNPDRPYAVEEKDKEMLMDLFNRGGFHNGYYKQKNGRNMISLDKPNHVGVTAVEVVSQKGREVIVKALTDIYKGDLIEFSNGTDRYTTGQDCKKGNTFMILSPKGMRIAVGTKLQRVRNQKLLESLAATYLAGKVKESIYGYLNISVGKPAKLIVCLGEHSVEVESEGIVEEAAKSPLDEDRIRKQLQKTGNTEFVFDTLDIEIYGNIFLPMQQLNEMRRTALEKLETAVCEKYHRYDEGRMAVCEVNREVPAKEKERLSVLVETEAQLEAVLASNLAIDRIYVESQFSGNRMETDFWIDIKRRVHDSGAELFLAMPRIFRKDTIRLFEETYHSTIESVVDGVLIRSMEEYQFLKVREYSKGIILDYNLYVMNRFANRFWKDQGILEHTVSVELNKQEICELDNGASEFIVYGYLPAMVTAQCITSTVYGCRKESSVTTLKDRFQNEFSVRNYCRDCYNIIYNTKPLYLFDLQTDLRDLGVGRYRIQFSTETRKESESILRQYEDIVVNNRDIELPVDQYTRGHFRRGIS